MTKNLPKNPYNSCQADETARGTLKDMGYANQTFGSDIHAFWAVTINWTPEWLRNFQRKAEGGANFGEYKVWHHI